MEDSILVLSAGTFCSEIFLSQSPAQQVAAARNFSIQRTLNFCVDGDKKHKCLYLMKINTNLVNSSLFCVVNCC